MADISKMKFPGDNTTYNLKDKGATRGFKLIPYPNIPHEYLLNFLDANDNPIYQRHLYIWFDGNTLKLGDLTTGDDVYASIDVPEVKLEFEPNTVTPTEFFLKIKVGGVEIDNHWFLFYIDNGDLVMNDWNNDIEVFRLPLLATKIDFDSEPGSPNNFYMNLRNNENTILSRTHCFINNRGGTFVFGYEDDQGVWHDIASC